MHSFELTDRGKITVAVLVVIPILILSIILAVLAMAADAPEVPPDEPLASSNQGATATPETPEPPDSGGFRPPYDNDYSDAPTSDDPTYSDITPEDTTIDDDSAVNNDADTSDSAPYGDPSLNLNAGRLSFNFYPQIQSSLDRRTADLLNTFLSLPSNTQDSTIAIETPVLSSEDSARFMSVMTSVLGEQGIDSRRITHIVNPELAIEDRFEVLMYFMTQEEK